jgi:transposase-like protein
MEREWLRERLEAGASYEAIGREVGCSASKVAYWAQKLGLSSRHAPRHAARGGIDVKVLHDLVEAGASIRDLASELNLSPTAVRHWLKRHGLATVQAQRRVAGREALLAGLPEADLPCPMHGSTRHVRRAGGFRCARCRVAQVSARRRRVKRILVEEAGGICVACGYDRCLAALHFHHVDPATKRFSLSQDGVTLSLEAARDEARKCLLLCANCHAEVESGDADLSSMIAERGLYAA